MTDYNDGKWHGWNGGECPVHPESELKVWFQSGFLQENIPVLAELEGKE